VSYTDRDVVIPDVVLLRAETLDLGGWTTP
jgi:hypothetical protein